MSPESGGRKDCRHLPVISPGRSPQKASMRLAGLIHSYWRGDKDEKLLAVDLDDGSGGIGPR